MTNYRQTDIVVFDETEPCPYLPEQVARMPLAMPRGPLALSQIDERLARGQRRSGEFVYAPRCPHCQACIPVRIDVGRFAPNVSQRRTWRKGSEAFQVAFGPMVVDQARIDLFNRHRQLRGLDRGRSIDSEDYTWGFVRSCFDSFEISYSLGDRLVGIALCDQGQESLSAVYTYFDPEYARYSPGVFSILTQIDYCRRTGRRYVYLGFYIAESPHMSYKRQFRPQERLTNGQWIEVASDCNA